MEINYMQAGTKGRALLREVWEAWKLPVLKSVGLHVESSRRYANQMQRKPEKRKLKANKTESKQ